MISPETDARCRDIINQMKARQHMMPETLRDKYHRILCRLPLKDFYDERHKMASGYFHQLISDVEWAAFNEAWSGIASEYNAIATDH